MLFLFHLIECLPYDCIMHNCIIALVLSGPGFFLVVLELDLLILVSLLYCVLQSLSLIRSALFQFYFSQLFDDSNDDFSLLCLLVSYD